MIDDFKEIQHKLSLLHKYASLLGNQILKKRLSCLQEYISDTERRNNNRISKLEKRIHHLSSVGQILLDNPNNEEAQLHFKILVNCSDRKNFYPFLICDDFLFSRSSQ